MKKPQKKSRKVDSHYTIEKRFYIFCEGEKTEPNYFQSFKDIISKDPIYKNTVFIDINGTGEEDIKILEYAKKQIKREGIKNAEVWIVYDKDDFPNERFDKVPKLAVEYSDNDDSVTYSVAWSNQCIEYWFILHFDYYTSDNDRTLLKSYIDKKLKTFGLSKYKKNDPNIYNILLKYGNPKQAIKFSERQLEYFNKKLPSQSAPATTVHKLVQELAKYLPTEERLKFLDEKIIS